MKTFIIFALIALSQVHCDGTVPSWTNQAALDKAITCKAALTTPTCAASACKTAWTTYGQQTSCSDKMGSFKDFNSCIQTAGTTFLADSNASSDGTAKTYVDGFNKCAAALNGSLLALSAFFMSIFALLF
ncbi:hypothetical protein ABPG72_000435 [Tetrahymena utriculariae]